MSGLANAAVIVAVVVLVVVRQIRPQPVADSGRWWPVPAVLLYLAVSRGGLLDAHHRVMSAALLAAQVAVGIGMGTVWAFTTRIWVGGDGVVWSQATRATAGAWAGGILLRVGLAGVGVLTGVRQGSGATMLALAATLLVRTGVVVWRSRRLEPGYRVLEASS